MVYVRSETYLHIVWSYVSHEIREFQASCERLIASTLVVVKKPEKFERIEASVTLPYIRVYAEN